MIAKSDRYVQTGKPSNINRAIRYYNAWIPKYERLGYPELKPDVARMYAKRASAYARLGNRRQADKDFAKARQLDASVSAPATPASHAASSSSGASTGTSSSTKPPAPATHPSGLPPVEGEPIPIAVLNFDSPGSEKAYGESFSPLLADDLFNRGRFDVIERDRLDKIMAEQKLSQSDLVEKAGTDEVRGLLPIDYMVLGTITVEGNGVVVNGRFVDWNNGKTVASRTVKKMCETSNVSFHFDELAHELGVALEKSFVERTEATGGQ